MFSLRTTICNLANHTLPATVAANVGSAMLVIITEEDYLRLVADRERLDKINAPGRGDAWCVADDGDFYYIDALGVMRNADDIRALADALKESETCQN